jgi:CBS domain containing-hemolysin-like protein
MTRGRENEARRIEVSESGQKAKEPSRPNVLDRVRALFGVSNASLRSEMEEALEEQGGNVDLSAQERDMLRNVLQLHELCVSDIMVPRVDIVGVSLDDSLESILSVFRNAGHSRLPVYAESLDDPRGMIHIRDFLNLVTDQLFALPERSTESIFNRKLSDTNIVRPVLFVPPSMPALELLVKMQMARTHMALVIDEYGGTDGLASIEDIVELIVGEIEDEHDPVEGPLISKLEDGSYLIDARAPLEEVEEAIGVSFDEIGEADSVETVGGLVTTVAGRVMAKGERVDIKDQLLFEVVEADPRRLRILKAIPLRGV